MAKEIYRGLMAIDMANGFTYIGKLFSRIVGTEDWLKEVLIVPTLEHYRIFQNPNVIQNALERYKEAYQKMVKKNEKNRKILRNIRLNRNMAIAIWDLDSVKAKD